jgi:adenylate cyclase
MNIIFGDSIKQIPDSFTVLELDTFRMVSDGRTDTAYCVIEKIALADFDKLEAYKKVHADLLENYRRREWTYCEHAIEGLMGKWNGELDSFYSDLLLRVQAHRQTPPGDDWDGVRVRV